MHRIALGFVISAYAVQLLTAVFGTDFKYVITIMCLGKEEQGKVA